MKQYQITYNTFLFNTAHQFGMAAILKVCPICLRIALYSSWLALRICIKQVLLP